MHSPVLIKPADERGFVVTFRDIPEAITQGDTQEEAQAIAADAFVTALEFYFEDNPARCPHPSLPNAAKAW